MRRVRLAEVVRVLPRHGHDLPRTTVADSQRWRLVEAIAEVVAAVGYADANVAAVIAAAGVSRKTFYEHFQDKEDCFLTAYDVLSDRLIDLLVEVGAKEAEGKARRRAQVAAFVEALARDPASARVFMVDVLGAGPAALARRERVNDRFGDALLGPGIEPVRRRAIVGGVNNVVAGTLMKTPKSAALVALVKPLSAFVEQALGGGRRRS